MRYKIYALLIITQLAFLQPALGQDLEKLLEEETQDMEEQVITQATFKTTRIVNGQSIENASPKELIFVVSHHFGEVSTGLYDFFGVDYSNIRLGFEYGLNDRIAVGIGRSSFNKYYDVSAKVKLLQQQKGKRQVPLSVSYFGSAAATAIRYEDPERQEDWTARLNYVHQLLIARKMSSKLSLQLSPVLVHSNMAPTSRSPNDVWALGTGGRYKLTNWVSLNAEYFYTFNPEDEQNHFNSFSAGVDLDTGGHIFQLYFTNSSGMIEKLFISGNNGDWLQGDFRFGFNITRVFSFGKE